MVGFHYWLALCCYAVEEVLGSGLLGWGGGGEGAYVVYVLVWAGVAFVQAEES